MQYNMDNKFIQQISAEAASHLEEIFFKNFKWSYHTFMLLDKKLIVSTVYSAFEFSLWGSQLELCDEPWECHKINRRARARQNRGRSYPR